MSLPRYPEYRRTAIEWLLEVPAHWTDLPVKRLAKVPITNGVGEAGAYDDPSWPRYLRITDIDGPRRLRNDVFKSLPPEVASKAPVDVGDLLIAAVGATYGKSYLHAVDAGPCCYAGYLIRFAPNEHLDSGFAAYWTESANYWAQVQSRVVQSTVQNFSAGKFRELAIALPTLDEQRRIASFLDRETAKIDALIAEQEKLLALLAEKRQATISHAVTRGLDPNAPMKDSGIPWLGEVPAHWEVSPLKYISRIGNGSTPNRDNPAYWSEFGFPWLSSSVVNQDEVTEADRFVTELALKECHLPVIRPPAVLVGITGQGKTRGMASLLMFEATINQHLAYILPGPGRLEVTYLLRALEMAYDTLRTDSESAGSTKGAITCEQLSRFTIPLPPLDEQDAIAKYIDIKAADFEKLASDSRQAIALLKERRSAIIAAAVTGQIDVRDLVEPEAA